MKSRLIVRAGRSGLSIQHPWLRTLVHKPYRFAYIELERPRVVYLAYAEMYRN